MNSTISKWSYSLLMVIFICSTSCTSAIKMSTSDFRNTYPDSKTLYRVTTKADVRYDFKQYSISDDTLMIYAPFSLDIHDKKKQEEHVTLLFDNIASIQKIGWDTKKSLFVAGMTGASLTGLILLMIVLAQPGSGL